MEVLQEKVSSWLLLEDIAPLLLLVLLQVLSLEKAREEQEEEDHIYEEPPEVCVCGIIISLNVLNRTPRNIVPSDQIWHCTSVTLQALTCTSPVILRLNN